MNNLRYLSIPCLLVSVQLSLAQTSIGGLNGGAVKLANSSLSVGLVLHLPLNGSVNDMSGYGNDGTIYGGLTFTADRLGNPNGAAAFNGMDSYISVPDNPSLHPVDQVSVCFWIRVDSIAANYSPLFSKAGPLLPYWSDREYYCELKQNYSNAYFEMYSAGDGYGQRGVDSRTFVIHQWMHFVGVIDRKSHQMSIYIDGILDASVPDSYSSFNQSTDPLLIGWTTESYPEKRPLKGAIADFRVYMRALTDNEILALAGKYVEVTPDSVGFGLVRVGTQDSVRVSVTNIQGPDPLMLGPISSTHGAFAVHPGTAAIPAGDSLSLTVVYSPTVAGHDTGTILIPTNNPQVPLFHVPVSGRGYTLTNAPIIASIRPAPGNSMTARIIWIRSLADSDEVADPVLRYGIWRRIDDARAKPLGDDAPTQPASPPSNDQGWMFVAECPAIGVERYVADVPISDSYIPPSGVKYAVFTVVAHTKELHSYRSDPDNMAFTGWLTAVDPEVAAVTPQHFVLEQNYPNPFNPSTTIRYGLPVRSRVTLTVFNTLGQLVATLFEGEQEAGYHEVRFNASGLASGVYLYRMQVHAPDVPLLDSASGKGSESRTAFERDSKRGAGDYVQTRKFILVH